MDVRVWDEVLVSQGAWASLWELARGLLDKAGVTWHRRELSSRTYRMLRGCFYSCVMTHAMLFGIVVMCYMDESSRRCGSLLGTWAAAVGAGVLHRAAYRAVGLALVCIGRRMHGCGWLRTAASSWCTGLCHLLALQVVALALYAALRVVSRCGLDASKAFVVVCASFGGLVFAQCSGKGAVRLLELERQALRAEQSARRRRLARSILTFEEILEVRRGSPTEDCLAVLEQQPVVFYDPETFAERSECCICSTAFDGAGEIRRAHCGHFFHSDCLSDWLARSPTCPLCREDLSQQLRQREAMILEQRLATVVGIPQLTP